MLTHAEPERVTGWMMVRRGLRLVSALSRDGFGCSSRAHLAWLVPFHRGIFGNPRRDIADRTADGATCSTRQIGTTP